MDSPHEAFLGEYRRRLESKHTLPTNPVLEKQGVTVTLANNRGGVFFHVPRERFNFRKFLSSVTIEHQADEGAVATVDAQNEDGTGAAPHTREMPFVQVPELDAHFLHTEADTPSVKAHHKLHGHSEGESFSVSAPDPDKPTEPKTVFRVKPQRTTAGKSFVEVFVANWNHEAAIRRVFEILFHKDHVTLAPPKERGQRQ